MTPRDIATTVHKWKADDSILQFLFGEDWTIARKLIDEEKDACAKGMRSDDYSYTMRMWKTHYDFSEDDIKINEITVNQEHSKLFDFKPKELARFSEGLMNMVQGWTALERRVFYYHNKAIEQKRKGDIKFGKTSIKTLRNQFAKIEKVWNEILADDVLTPEELRTLTETIHKCRIYADDFVEFEDFVYNVVLVKPSVGYADSIKVYEHVVKILELINSRIEMKQQQEANAVAQS